MRRQEREVTNILDILQIMKKCYVCRIAIWDGAKPYIVPMNFGYAEHNGQIELYFHSHIEGTKIALMKSNPHVAFEMESGHRLKGEGLNACNYSYLFESICGNGLIEFITGPKEKHTALERLMFQMTKRTDFDFPAEAANNLAVFKIAVKEITGKRNGAS